jgi:hypothetical protein
MKVRFYSILISILLNHYKQLTECIKQVEQIEAKVEGLVLQQQKKEEEAQRLGIP